MIGPARDLAYGYRRKRQADATLAHAAAEQGYGRAQTHQHTGCDQPMTMAAHKRRFAHGIHAIGRLAVGAHGSSLFAVSITNTASGGFVNFVLFLFTILVDEK